MEYINVTSTQYFPEDVEGFCDCSVPSFYGNTDEDGNLKKDNMFSEFTDDYQRAKARENLGISDEYTLQWGNIEGNVVNQIDLCIYIDEAIKKAIAKLK